MAINIAIGFVGIIISLFIFWKRLKEDYASEIIFATGALIYLFLAIGYILSNNFFPKWFFWISIVSVLMGLGISIYRYKIRFYESLEAVFISLLPLFSINFLKDSVLSSSLSSFIAFITSLSFFYVFYYFDSHYKSFSWYKSGKIGFAGLATFGIFFLLRAAIAIFFPGVLSFVVVYEPYLSGVAAFVVSILIFNLGRQEK